MGSSVAQEMPAANSEAAAKTFSAKAEGSQPAITIYNADFAVVRQMVPLDLSPGVNHITFSNATAHIEPDSVILRDPSGRHELQVLEQNYRNDPVSQAMMLSLFEGKTINFAVQRTDSEGHTKTELIPGKIIRSGYAHGQNNEPVILVDGKIQFSLPGQPVFPNLGDGTILEPTLDWLLESDKPGALDSELSYVTGGLSWHADYNIVAPEKGDVIDLIGWVTMSNESGHTFEDARIKLMAGDVNKIQPQSRAYDMAYAVAGAAMNAKEMAPVVREHAFDEFHLYSLEHSTTLRDHETKQVEFVAATQVQAKKIYVYNGAAIDNYSYYSPEQIRNDMSFGTQSNAKVWVMEEFKNSKDNHMGMPLPKGRLRFYRRDNDGQLEFTGENMIDHTPADETVRVYTGNAFDIVGERHRTNYKVDSRNNWMDESFEIKVRNHKKEAAEVRVVEKLYRWTNWQITDESQKHRKFDAQTVEFRVVVPPSGEQTVDYTVHYSW